MPTAEIISIGTELLLGEIVDTNSQTIARALRDLGVDLYWKTTVGDNINRIALALQQALHRSNIIITTGGLGPTVDDPTREAVALAVGVETEFHPELWEQIQDRFRRFGRPPTENNQRQAYVPMGALPVENPVGTAPAFIVEAGDSAIISLPGVPREMEYLMAHAVTPYLMKRFELKSVIVTRLLHTAGAGESQIDAQIEDLEKLQNPTVGLAAYAGRVDVRITAKASSVEEANKMIHIVEADVRERLGEWIYGVDDETLEDIALKTIERHHWRLSVVEAGFNGELTQGLASSKRSAFVGGEVLVELPDPEELPGRTARLIQDKDVEVALGAMLQPGGERQQLYLVLITPLEERAFHISYGGPPSMAPQWAINQSLNLLRKLKE